MYYYIFESQIGPKVLERSTQIKEHIAQLGIAGEMSAPTPGRGVEDLVEIAISKRYSTIIAVGGIELVNRMARALEPYDVVFGIIPTIEHPDLTELIGTNDWKLAAEQLKRRRFIPVQLGSLNDQHCFLTPARLELGDGSARVSTAEFAATVTGGSITLQVTSEDLDPPATQVLSVSMAGLPEQLGGFARLFRKPRPAPVSAFTAPWCEIVTAQPCTVKVAGQPVTQTPVRVAARPKPIKLIVTRAAAPAPLTQP